MARSTKGYVKPAKGEYILRDGWYWPTSPCRKGHTSPRNAFGQCVACTREYRAKKGHFTCTEKAVKWRKDNTPHLNALRRSWAERNPKKTMVNACRRTAKAKGLPFDLSPEDFDIPDRCPVLGFPLERSTAQPSDRSPSLDKIIPALGYVKGNVVVISWRANRLKQDATIEELKLLSNFYQHLSTKD